MPLFDYQCPNCGSIREYLVVRESDQAYCCGDTVCVKLPGAASFKIKGARAANSYGLKYEDTYGCSPVTGEETGCSFSSNRGGTIEHKFTIREAKDNE